MRIDEFVLVLVRVRLNSKLSHSHEIVICCMLFTHCFFRGTLAPLPIFCGCHALLLFVLCLLC